MAYLNFNKDELVNLEYSLKREVLSTNSTGGYCNNVIISCNNRKYHGLFIVPLDSFGGKRFILLSDIDETLIQHGKSFNLGVRCYGDIYEPKGHKYIRNFQLDKDLTLTYRVGGMVFEKSVIFSDTDNQMLIKYTLIEANSPTMLKIKPFLAYRDIHELTTANSVANTKYADVDHGCSYRMYEGFPELYLQWSKKGDYVHNPDWYYGVVYKEEERRGYANKEDLFCPGFFEFHIAKGEAIVLSISTKEEPSKAIKKKYESLLAKASSRDNYESCLKLAAKQFIVNRNGVTRIVAGYSWMGSYLREALIALPGLTLFNDGDVKTFEEVLRSIVKERKEELLNAKDQAETPLWFFWDIQKLIEFGIPGKEVWSGYRTILWEIINQYLEGKREGVELNKDTGLLWSSLPGVALSWMNAYVDGIPVTERAGYQVETNALWYNALSFMIEMEGVYTTKISGDLTKVRKIRDSIKDTFFDTFWVEERSHLADYVDDNGKNNFTRPNQLLSVALPYTPIGEECIDKVLKAVRSELLTARGIRTLAPKNLLYKGIYEGNQIERDLAYHQGSTRVWLLGFYIDISLKLYGRSFIGEAESLIKAFEEDMTIHGVGTISELYDGDPPHNPHGAISHSPAVAELIRSRYLIEKIKK